MPAFVGLFRHLQIEPAPVDHRAKHPPFIGDVEPTRRTRLQYDRYFVGAIGKAGKLRNSQVVAVAKVHVIAPVLLVDRQHGRDGIAGREVGRGVEKGAVPQPEREILVSAPSGQVNLAGIPLLLVHRKTKSTEIGVGQWQVHPCMYRYFPQKLVVNAFVEEKCIVAIDDHWPGNVVQRSAHPNIVAVEQKAGGKVHKRCPFRPTFCGNRVVEEELIDKYQFVEIQAPVVIAHLKSGLQVPSRGNGDEVGTYERDACGGQPGLPGLVVHDQHAETQPVGSGIVERCGKGVEACAQIAPLPTVIDRPDKLLAQSAGECGVQVARGIVKLGELGILCLQKSR